MTSADTANGRRHRSDEERPVITGALPRIDPGRHQHRPLALVTGATSGIGLAVAENLAADYDLVLLARTAADLEQLAELLRTESDAEVRTCAVDLTDDDALAQAVADLDIERLDLIVHSAGVEAPARVEELTPAQWRSVLDLDLVAVAHLTSLLLPALRRARGLVVMINSGAGLRSGPGQSLYCAAKAGLRALADSLREEERGKVRVCTIYPGRVDTPMQKRIHHAKVEHLRSQGEKTQRYRAADHMTPASVAATVRLAADMPVDAVIEDLAIRPGGML